MQICIPFIFNTCLAEPVFALFRKHYKSRLAGLERAIWSGSTVLSSQIEKKKYNTKIIYNWNAAGFVFVWFDSLRPINNLSVKHGRVFLGWTSNKLG